MNDKLYALVRSSGEKLAFGSKNQLKLLQLFMRNGQHMKVEKHKAKKKTK